MRFFLLLFVLPLFSKTICLNMIVKNESAVIERCLNSVKELIDYWVIVDTGSTDGTQKIIREFLKGIPGELHERPWVDFAHNRNEALAFAKGKGDFLLFMDADEYLVFPNGKKRPRLDQEAYLFPYQDETQSYTYYRIALIDNHLPWTWKGEMHETIESLLTRPKTHEYYRDIVNRTHGDGGRSQDPKKVLKDAEILLKMLEKNPDDPRTVFYLAQSYLNGHVYDLALKYLEKRVGMEGCPQEKFWSLYQLANVQDRLEKDPQTVIDSYCRAYQFRPTRVEPIYRLASFYQKIGNPTMAYITAKQGLSVPLSSDSVYVENWIYDFGIPFELAYAAAKLGLISEAEELYLQILAKEHAPPELKDTVKKNLLCLKNSSR